MPNGMFPDSFQFILMYLSGKEHIERGGKGRRNLKGNSVYHIQADQSEKHSFYASAPSAGASLD